MHRLNKNAGQMRLTNLHGQQSFTAENFAGADMDGDGSVTVFDLGALKKFVTAS